jgi:hypothetical protein
VAALQKQVKELQLQYLVDKKKIEDKTHELSVLPNNAKRTASSNTKQKHDLLTSNKQMTEFRRQVGELEKRCEKQARCICTVEVEECDHYLNGAQDLAKRVDMLLDNIRDAEGVVFTLRKELGEMETKAKQQEGQMRIGLLGLRKGDWFFLVRAYISRNTRYSVENLRSPSELTGDC